MQERIQKIMAEAGIASRRKCEVMIKKGLVKVNGKTIKLGDKADYEKEKIEFDGKLIKKEKKVYIMINKPKGVLSSVKDDRGRKTIVDLVKTDKKVFTVGRLDLDSEGLMILTNDGDFANKIIHPRYNIKKTYLVILDRSLNKMDNEKIMKGITIEGRKLNVFDLKQNKGEITLSIHEGRKHIIKKLFDLLGYEVIDLKRISIGNLKLNLRSSECKIVSKEWLKDNIF